MYTKTRLTKIQEKKNNWEKCSITKECCKNWNKITLFFKKNDVFQEEKSKLKN